MYGIKIIVTIEIKRFCLDLGSGSRLLPLLEPLGKITRVGDRREKPLHSSPPVLLTSLLSKVKLLELTTGETSRNSDQFAE
jgi:hypothetical protein